MELKDLVVTPIVLLLLYFLAYKIKPKVCTVHTKKYFMTALTLKFVGALALGVIYQFYYGGGDTFGYTTHGSSYIWDAFISRPSIAFNLIFLDNVLSPETFKYASRMWYFDDDPTYFVVRVAGFLGLFTFNTYSSIALIFALIGFSGLWAFYSKLAEIFPNLSFEFFIAFFSIPSVIFWGSGIMKDTLTLSALGWACYAIFNIFLFRNKQLQNALILFISFWVLSIVKIYILLCFLPAVCVLIFLSNLRAIKSLMVRIMLKPLFFFVAIFISYYGISTISSGNNKYSMQNILKTAEITAKDNSMWTVREEGSGYNLGDYDFSPSGLLRKFIPAVWVTLYRPYIWESNGITMLISAIESLFMLLFTAYVILKIKINTLIDNLLNSPIVSMFIIFTITFSFAVGISSGNFGSLVRYKIPIIPTYLAALFILIQANFSSYELNTDSNISK